MSLHRDELQEVSGAVGADATIGTLIPQNMVRFIYRIKFINNGVGANQLVLGKRENGAGATTDIDTVQAAVANEMIFDPDELEEDAVPLYKIYGAPGNVAVAPNSAVRARTTAGAGIFTYWYVDKEA